MEDCVFCQIVKKELPAKFEWEDDEIVAFRDIKPLAPVHVLIVPKKHIPQLKEASKEDQEVLGRIQFLAGQLAEKLGIGGAFRVLVANGEKAGQSVFHLHYHLMGGWKNGAPVMEAG